jgi:S1-C subfamily serine protease
MSLTAWSNEIAGLVARAGSAVVAVEGNRKRGSSGVIWRPGLIVTVEHALAKDDQVEVILPDGARAVATVVGKDAGTDLALLRLAEARAELTLAHAAQAGQIALAVGRAADTGVNATLGVLSAVSGPWRTWRGGRMERFLRLDIALFPATDGGLVLNAAGEVLGVATSALSRLAGVAIPAETVNRIVDALLQPGARQRGYLGVGLQAVPYAAASALIVLSVEPGSPAQRAGLLVGDLLTAANQQPLRDTDDLLSLLDPESVGQTLALEIVRGGQPVSSSLTIGTRQGA